jgi:hypothetical protein
MTLIEMLRANGSWEADAAASKLQSQADYIEKLEAALRSIAANACCDSCREAALVARKALDAK